MFEDEYEFDYDRILQDTDELYEIQDDTNNSYDYIDERLDSEHYEYYYHNLADELDD